MSDRVGVHRVGAFVDGVNGYRCTLTILPSELRIQLGGPFVRLLSSGMYRRTLVHPGPDVVIARVKWHLPWMRAAVLLYKPEHRVMVPMSNKKADRLANEMRANGLQLTEVPVPWSGGALLEDLWLREALKRQGKVR